jgi:hypothetical protein
MESGDTFEPGATTEAVAVVEAGAATEAVAGAAKGVVGAAVGEVEAGTAGAAVEAAAEAAAGAGAAEAAAAFVNALLNPLNLDDSSVGTKLVYNVFLVSAGFFTSSAILLILDDLIHLNTPMQPRRLIR